MLIHFSNFIINQPEVRPHRASVAIFAAEFTAICTNGVSPRSSAIFTHHKSRPPASLHSLTNHKTRPPASLHHQVHILLPVKHRKSLVTLVFILTGIRFPEWSLLPSFGWRFNSQSGQFYLSFGWGFDSSSGLQDLPVFTAMGSIPEVVLACALPHIANLWCWSVPALFHLSSARHHAQLFIQL